MRTIYLGRRKLNITRTILYKSFVQPFYKQNAGLFAFLVFIMVAAVGRANGVGLLEYHLSLIRAMMTDGKFLIVILIAWLLYALKSEQFMVDRLHGKDYSFISILNTKTASFVFTRMLEVQIMLSLPVLLYAFISIWIGIKHHWYGNALIVLSFNLAICLAGAWRYSILIRQYGIIRSRPFLKISFPFPKGLYLRFIFEYIGNRRKMLFIAVKIFSCIFLYGMLRSYIKDDSDMKMVLLFYSFALLGHGVLIYNIRQMEEVNLTFYRALPVSLTSRILQYVVLYLILFVPEIIIILQMTPVFLNYQYAFVLIFFGYGILLLLNSILFVRLVRPFDYLKIVSGIYLMIFIAVLTGITIPFTIGLFLISVYLFFQNYYGFEKV
jgi:hypothetical protein